MRIFQPVHGYFVRRELLTWRVEQWASINPGAIDNALRTLEREGFIRAADPDEKPIRYSLTGDGEIEFATLLREALWHVVPLLLSGILLPVSLAPGWLETVSAVYPVKHVVDGVRALFLEGHITMTVVWGVVAALGLVAAGLVLGTRTFERESG